MGTKKISRKRLWSHPGVKGKLRSLSTEVLQIGTYQRPEVSAPNTGRIAKAFNWPSFGTLTVMERRDGQLFVVDGLQRLLAARRRGIRNVPCMVSASKGPSDEAKVFHNLNVNRHPVSPIHNYKVCVEARIPPECDIDKWLKPNGFRVANGKTTGTINFPKTLTSRWKQDPEASKAALLIQKQLTVDEAMHNGVHKGLHYLFKNGVNVNEHLEKLVKSGGIAAIHLHIKRLEINTLRPGGQASSNALFATAILQVINKGRKRNRIKLPAPKEAEATEPTSEDDEVVVPSDD